MSSQAIEKLLADNGVLVTGSHFVFNAGDHGAEYVNKDALYPNTTVLSVICAELASRAFRLCRPRKIESVVVVGPAVGATLLSSWTAYHLNQLGVKAIGVYADKAEIGFTLSEGELIKVNGQYVSPPAQAKLSYSDGSFVLKRGYDKKVKGKDVILVEDVLTTGGSAERAAEAVRSAGGNVLMLAAFCNRGGVTAEKIGVPHLEAIYDVSFERFPEAECPLCKNNVPINTELGHGKAFLARKPQASVQ